MFENNLYYYPDLWVAIKMETDSNYEYVGPHISAAHRQRLVELRFESGEPNGLQMLMALLPPGGRLIAYGNGMDALSVVADWWPMIMAWQQTDSQPALCAQVGLPRAFAEDSGDLIRQGAYCRFPDYGHPRVL